MLTDLHVLESGDLMLLDVPAETHAATLERLDRFLFAEDVQIASLAGELTTIWLHGPRGASVLASVIEGTSDPGVWPNYHLEKGTFRNEPVVVVRNNQLTVPGYCVYLSPVLREAFRAALLEQGATVLGSDASFDDASPFRRDEALEAARIEAAYPLFGVDMTEETIPLEAGIEGRAISLTKGCYVGQEVIIRVLHRGHGRVAKKLVALRSEGDPLVAGARLSVGARDVGFITSASISPAHGAVALGYVHRDFVEPGTAVIASVGERAVPIVVGSVFKRP
jgi:folate-binding protein YgfZ